MPDSAPAESRPQAPARADGEEQAPAEIPTSEQPTAVPAGDSTPGETLESSGRPTGLAEEPECSLIGQEFDDFIILEEVGRGGMGCVYKARQKSLDRIVAVKVLPNAPDLKTALVTRFLAEARAAASLNHPNIVRIYQVGKCPMGHYFAMEFVDGEDLEKLTLRDGRCRQMPVLWSVNIMIPVTRAVAFAHARGIVHRDLKPGNIMIGAQMRPMVMDFGIAKVIGRSSGLTVEGAILGTPAYMSPEQAGDHPDTVGPLSDVYSLGAILYRLLTGRLTYAAESVVRTLVKVVSPQMPPTVRSLRPEVPAGLDQLVMKCLSKNPTSRFGSASALVDALTKQLPHVETAAHQTDLIINEDSAAEDSPDGGGNRDGLGQAPPKQPAQRAPKVTLVVTKTGQRIRLRKRENLIGRSAECAINVKAADVSKHHCRIVLKRDAAVVEDLDSANGTFVNNKSIKSARLKDGDILAVADHTFEVRVKSE